MTHSRTGPQAASAMQPGALYTQAVYMRPLAKAAQEARTCGPSALAQRLTEARARTLGLLQAYVDALGPTLTVPCTPELNPPLWEVGHVAWFQAWWVSRNAERQWGAQANPHVQRPPCWLPHADDLYNSSVVAHSQRWQLPLPKLQGTLDYLNNTLTSTLALLNHLHNSQGEADCSDHALYFFRLVLMHEHMHAEAAVYMAQSLGIDLPAQWAGNPVPHTGIANTLSVDACTWTLGWQGPGFAFDNELLAHPVQLNAFGIDACPVKWHQYLQFVQATGHAPPRYIRKWQGQWQQQSGSAWHALHLQSPASHVTAHDAQAYCQWAGRRLPTEAEWECAAMTQPEFEWGQVWEWTSSAFEPFAGFVAHPYEDYSQPWFDGRPVLKGACWATHPDMRHPKYRNYFTAERDDIIAGFRTCA